MPHRGWGNGAVPVERSDGNHAAIMDVEVGRLSACYVHGLIDTRDRLEEGQMFCTVNIAMRRARAIVPAKYTHAKVKKTSTSVGFRWRMGFCTPDDCRELVDRVEEKRPDVLLYRGPRASATLEVGKGYAKLDRFSLEGKEEGSLASATAGPYRGTFVLPAGPILLQMDCLVPWVITLQK